MEETRRSPSLDPDDYVPSFRTLPSRHRSKLLQHIYGRRGTGIFNSGNPKKQIRDLQKIIDLLNKSIEDHAKDEKDYLDMAADTSRELETLSKSVLESTKMFLLSAKGRAHRGIRYHAGWMLVLRYEVEYVQRLLKKQIEALQDAEFFTAQKTRRRLRYLEQVILYYDTPFDDDLKIVSTELQMVKNVASTKCEIQVISDISYSSTVHSSSSTSGLVVFKNTFPV